MVRRFMILTGAALALVAMTSPAFATTVIDFRNGPASAGGIITYDGTNVIGTDLPIGQVEIHEAPLMNGVYTTTGLVANSTGFYADLDFDTGANTISINGCIPGLGIGTVVGNDCTGPALLLSGTITGQNIQAGLGVVSFFGNDWKNRELLMAIGLDPNTPFDVFGFTLLTDPLIAGGPAEHSISTDIRNTAVPEPATMVLLGTGLLAAFRARRRMA